MKKLITSFLVFDVAILALLFFGGFIGNNLDVKVPEYELAIKNNKGILVDVRTPEEYGMEWIDGAINIDWKNESFKNEIQKLDKNEPVLIYCRSGARAGNAKRMMQKLGFKKVLNLKGGIKKWKSKGMTTKKGSNYSESHSAGEEGC